MSEHWGGRMVSPKQSFGYIIDVELGAETARLIEQEKLLTRAMGGPVPAPLSTEHVHDVLDMGCGPGSWGMNMAYHLPEATVVGLDNNRTMIQYATAQALTRHLQNVSFELGDATNAVDMSDETFDLINARFVASFLTQETWPSFLKECARLLRPGGIVLLTEWETAVSSSPALQQLGRLLAYTLMEQQRTFSVDGCSLGIVHQQGQLLREAGFVDVHRFPFLLDGDVTSPLYTQLVREYEQTFALVKPYILAGRRMSAGEYDALYEQMMREVYQPSFTHLGFAVSTWARKPLKEQE